MGPRSRATTLAASAAIVVTVALLALGVVAGQPGAQRAVDEQAIALAAGSAPIESTTVTVHTHDSDVATAPGTPTTAHGSSGHTSAADDSDDHAQHTETATGAGAVAPASEAHDQHVNLLVSGASPGVTAPAHGHDPEVITTVPGATTATTTHDHGGTTTVPPTTLPGAPTTTTVPTGPIISINDSRLTAAQSAAAVDLLARTKAAMHAFPDEAAVVAAGYISIGDGVTGFEHFVNVGYLTDDHEVDPNHIESIVLRVSGATKTVESAMYILSTGSTMADVPEIGGELTTWHDHQNLCWEGIRVVAVTDADGNCPRGEFRATAPMLHVWLTDQPCGPFAGIEGHGSCHSH